MIGLWTFWIYIWWGGCVAFNMEVRRVPLLFARGGLNMKVRLGASWARLGTPGCVWHGLGASGSAWERLGAPGSVWERLGASGNVSGCLGAFGNACKSPTASKRTPELPGALELPGELQRIAFLCKKKIPLFHTSENFLLSQEAQLPLAEEKHCVP